MRRPLPLLLTTLLLASCSDAVSPPSAALPAAPAAPSAVAVASAATPGAPVAATTAASSPKPPPIVSPEVKGDHSVTFRLKAVNAKEVQVRGQWAKEPLTLTRDAQGIWVATSAPLPAGVWEYSMVVDGLTMIDPMNAAIKPMREPRTSILTLPGSPSLPWDFQDVPHGTLHQHDYLSKAFGVERELMVYTPPGYETAKDAVYPLLVLQHGSGDNQMTWTVHGKAHWIFDNLIASGAARPMVVVMINGHQPPRPPQDGVTPAAQRRASLDGFQRELLEDALPLVDALYRVERKRELRAIAGLSMGGGQALSIGLANLDRFAWIGAFSASAPDNDMIKPALDDVAGTNDKLKLLWIAIGKDDGLREKLAPFEAGLTQKGIHHDWLITEGGHSWPVWRGYLVEFVPKLFKP